MKQRGGGPNAQQAPRIAAYAHAGGKNVFWISHKEVFLEDLLHILQ